MKGFMHLCLAAIFALLFSSCSDKINVSGNENSETISYNGIAYKSQDFFCAADDLTSIGYIENGAAVYSVGNTEAPEYIVIAGSDNSRCFAADGSNIPTCGKITKALIDPSIRGDNSLYISSEKDLSTLEKLTQFK